MYPKKSFNITHSFKDSQEMSLKQQTVFSLPGCLPCVIFSNAGTPFRVIFSTARDHACVTFSSLQPGLRHAFIPPAGSVLCLLKGIGLVHCSERRNY